MVKINMKIRLNYVSNSSSSSYIVEFKDLEQIVRISGEEISVQDFIDAINYNSYNSSETELYQIIIDDEERADLLKLINEQYLVYANKENKVKLKQLVNDIKNTDKKFIRFDISYHNKALRFLLNLLCKYELLTIRYRVN